LKKLPLKNLAIEGNKITFDVVEPDKENWPAVEAIVHTGGHVNTVSVLGSTLEDVYLKLVREESA
jgi:hypothetical protein